MYVYIHILWSWCVLFWSFFWLTTSFSWGMWFYVVEVLWLVNGSWLLACQRYLGDFVPKQLLYAFSILLVLKIQDFHGTTFSGNSWILNLTNAYWSFCPRTPYHRLKHLAKFLQPSPLQKKGTKYQDSPARCLNIGSQDIKRDLSICSDPAP